MSMSSLLLPPPGGEDPSPLVKDPFLAGMDKSWAASSG